MKKINVNEKDERGQFNLFNLVLIKLMISEIYF